MGERSAGNPHAAFDVAGAGNVARSEYFDRSWRASPRPYRGRRAGMLADTGPSGQARYRDAAIQTSLMLRTAFKLALRQTEGLMTSVLTLMGLTISAPDHSTVSRRAETLPVIQPASVPPGPLHVLIDSTGLQVYGAGQWLEAKHGAKSRRTWRKLHLAVDAASGMIVAQTLPIKMPMIRLRWRLCSIRLTAGSRG
jgi:hypothetical protein